MNEKIKEIFDRSNEESIADWKKGIRYETSYEKFAELIVKECIDICKSHKIQSTDDVWYLAHNETVNNISENIEEYFGVEE